MANRFRNRNEESWKRPRQNYNRGEAYGQSLENEQNINYGYEDPYRRRQQRYESGTNYGRPYSESYDDYRYRRGWEQPTQWGSSQQYNRGRRYGESGYGSYRDVGSSEGTSYGTGYHGSTEYGQGRYEGMSRYGGDTSNYGNANQGGVERGWWDKTRDEVSSWFGDDDAERRRRMDRLHSNRGKGPRGYNRSDERIIEDVNDRLSDDPIVDASDIEIKVENSTVILSGHVDTREEKRRAEDIVENISGVKDVENRIKVTARGEEEISRTTSESNRVKIS